MKKKFFAIYALVGALVASPVFTSCVDDEESASVTALRDAKAEQLKSLAALNNAKAQAESIIAAAEAAYKQAQAAHEQALASASEAEQARLEQQFAVTLEQIKAEAEQAISAAKLQALRNQANIDKFADQQLQSLYYSLQSAISELNWLNEEKLNIVNSLNQAKAGIVMTEAERDYYVKLYDKYIAQQEFKIATYEKYEGADIEKLKNDRTIAEKERDQLREATIPYQEAYNKAEEAYNDSCEVYNEAYNETLNRWNSELVILELATKWIDSYDSEWTGSGSVYYRDMIVESELALTENFTIYKYSLNKELTAWFKEKAQLNVDALKERIGTPAVAATATTEAVAATGLYVDIENWKEQIADWEEELVADPTKTYLQDQISDNERYIAERENQIDGEKIVLAEREEKLADIVTLEAAFAADSDEMVAYEAAIAAQKALAEAADKALAAKEEADEKLEKAWEAYDEKSAEIDVLNNKINNSTNVDSIIEDCNYWINRYKSYKQGYMNDVSDAETQIAILESQLESVEARIAAQEAIIAGIQEDIDELVGTEETPAE